MRLVPYHPRLLPDLTRLINTHIHLVPPGWEVMESQVAAILANPLSLWEAHFSDDDGIVEPQETLFVTDGDTLLAAANWDVFQLSPHPRNASLNWILADPDHPAALTLLLNSLIERARCRLPSTPHRALCFRRRLEGDRVGLAAPDRRFQGRRIRGDTALDHDDCGN